MKEKKKETELQEFNRYSDNAFPIGMYTVTIDGIEPEGRGYLDLHWHEELQYTMMLSGSCTMQVNGEDYLIGEGQAIFINRNLLHVTKELSPDGKYFSINFPDKLLGYFVGSRMELDYVRPYTSNLLFPVMVFDKSTEWHGRILENLMKLRDLLLKKEGMYQYRAAMLLTEVWYEEISHVGAIRQPSAAYIRRQDRMQKMLTFIHEHYAEDIFVEDIAASAGISGTECARCFRETIHESPNKYLIKYRISRAVEILSSTDMQVTEVAFECGFNDTSHFIDCFRKRIGKTPFEYRNKR